MAIDEALEELPRVDQRKGRVVELRFFGGLNIEETARPGSCGAGGAAGTDDTRAARLSPDGRWILYLAWPKTPPHAPAGEDRLMRMAAGGGAPETMLRVTGFAIARASAYPAFEPEHPRFRCPSVSRAPCILSESVQGRVVLTAFDPVAGRKGELPTAHMEPRFVWDVSPDGRWIAAATQDGLIRLAPLAGQAPREIVVEGTPALESIAWAADSSRGEPLLHISLDGRAQMLYRGSKHVPSPVASPDGSYLAFSDLKVESNAWVIENFR